jgi:hypothetical protein
MCLNIFLDLEVLQVFLHVLNVEEIKWEEGSSLNRSAQSEIILNRSNTWNGSKEISFTHAEQLLEHNK